MGEEDKQTWLFPEVGESIEYHRQHSIGKKVSEGEIYPVPSIFMDEEVRRTLLTWPMEISSRRIVINKPFTLFAQLGPDVLIDFKYADKISKVEFQTGGKNIVIMKIIFKDGEEKLSSLILHENGKVEYKMTP